jgi:multidrug efflux pump subunit AcrB
MSTDIFPNINIPVVSVIWSYAGVAPEEMEKRFVTVSERAMTTTVNDIEHIESQSYNGVSVIKARKHRGSSNFDQVRARMQKTANDEKGKLYG